MSYPRPPGGLFPLTTRPTGNNAGGLYPLSAVLSDAIRSLAPTAYWKLDEASGNLADVMSGGYTATVTGSPTYGVAAPSPIGRGVTWSGSGQYATTATNITTPTTAMTVLLAFSTTNATGAIRYLAGRSATNQNSWAIALGATHALRCDIFQSGGSAHANRVNTTPLNTGAWMLVAMTFDGTTLTAHQSVAGVVSGGTSTSLTGTWHTASTAAVQIAAANSGSPFPGTIAHPAYWTRAITSAEFRWLSAVAFGG